MEVYQSFHIAALEWTDDVTDLPLSFLFGYDGDIEVGGTRFLCERLNITQIVIQQVQPSLEDLPCEETGTVFCIERLKGQYSFSRCM